VRRSFVLSLSATVVMTLPAPALAWSNGTDGCRSPLSVGLLPLWVPHSLGPKRGGFRTRSVPFGTATSCGKIGWVHSVLPKRGCEFVRQRPIRSGPLWFGRLCTRSCDLAGKINMHQTEVMSLRAKPWWKSARLLCAASGLVVGYLLFLASGFLRDDVAEKDASWSLYLLGWLGIGLGLLLVRDRPGRWIFAGTAGVTQCILAIAVMSHGDGDGLWGVVLFAIIFCASAAGGLAELGTALRKAP
jgi:hypothetical protein